jgi:hypothetical protein
MSGYGEPKYPKRKRPKTKLGLPDGCAPKRCTYSSLQPGHLQPNLGRTWQGGRVDRASFSVGN